MKALPSVLVTVLTLARASLALADDAPIRVATPERPVTPSAPIISLGTAPVEAAVPRTFHMHEGFYLRASVGFGDYRASFSDGHRSNLDFGEHGHSMALDFLLGGSPNPGLSIGGGLLLEPLFGADYDRHGYGAGSHGGFSALIGPFIDGFPDATRGFHLGGLIGFAAQSFQNLNSGDASRTRAAGVGGAAWFGYDFWVASEWALGPQLRLMGMRTSGTKSDEDVSAWARSFTLGVSAVFN